MAPKLEEAFFNTVAPVIGIVCLGASFAGAAVKLALEKLTGKSLEQKPSLSVKVMGPYV